MRIITISRAFGSGGRELGKRLADQLGFDYYDREIITAIASKKSMDEAYVSNILENHGWSTFPLTFRNSFVAMSSFQLTQTSLLLVQEKTIEKIAQAGKDFIIVGRNADVLLKDYEPFNIFVCADMDARIRRCASRAPEHEHMTEKELEREIRQIDKNRARTRQLITDRPWGDGQYYHLTVNTTSWSIKELTPAVADFASRWFERTSL